MRIISGKLKGKNIEFLKSSTTRPLKDSVKENIFNILIHSPKININIEKSNVLDLYSGIGSFGLECVSHEAKKVTFVEKDQNALRILKKNILKLSVKNQTSIIEGNIENYLRKNIKEKYEIFFLDPPFSDEHYIENLKILRDSKIFNKEHVVLIHREKSSQDSFEGILNSIFVKVYGRSKVIFGIFNSKIFL